MATETIPIPRSASEALSQIRRLVIAREQALLENAESALEDGRMKDRRRCLAMCDAYRDIRDRIFEMEVAVNKALVADVKAIISGK
jgi:hypothetical protein